VTRRVDDIERLPSMVSCRIGERIDTTSALSARHHGDAMGLVARALSPVMWSHACGVDRLHQLEVELFDQREIGDRPFSITGSMIIASPPRRLAIRYE